MKKYTFKEPYKPLLNLRETEKAIKLIKDFFERRLAEELNLERVSAPLFVIPETGLNDDLNGVERKVAFGIKDLGGQTVEIVQSLAKWKRNALHRYGYSRGTGLYTDMNALRRDEELGNLHSVYVDQWDWEVVISREQRTKACLEETVRKIYRAVKVTEDFVAGRYPRIKSSLPDEIRFVTSQELEDAWPELDPRGRETKAAEQYGAIFVHEIGAKLKSGVRHDGRAPDYDDWKLNGDIILWNPVLNCAFEISSMGIRVDENALKAQLAEAGCEDRLERPFHRGILDGALPLSIGGGIGQSRLCMFYLKKVHVGEVQVSAWPEAMLRDCEARNIPIL